MKKLLVFCVLIVFACKETVEPVTTEYTIEPKLQKYVDSFFKEAESRGKVIAKENLIVRINNGELFEICGTCSLNEKNPAVQRVVEIKTGTYSCWDGMFENDREALIFHELGHCLLGRIKHKNDLFGDGTPKSIMVSNNTDLYGPCVYAIDDNIAACNKTNRRKYYIDELFDEKTPKPSWAK